MLFDLSNLNRQAIIDNILSCQDRLINKPLTINTIFYILKKQIVKHYPILVKKRISSDKNFLIGGWFLIEKDCAGKKSIVVDIFFPKNDAITLSKTFFICIVKSIADTILHEIIHMRQYRSCNYRISKIPSYFSKIELQAYAFNIACEILDQSKSIDNIEKKIEKNQILKYSNTWMMYVDLCKYNYTHIILARLKKYVLQSIPLAKKGFPFKSAKWLK